MVPISMNLPEQASLQKVGESLPGTKRIGRKKEMTADRYKVSFGGRWKYFRIDYSDSCTCLWIHWKPSNCTL